MEVWGKVYSIHITQQNEIKFTTKATYEREKKKGNYST